MHYDVQVLPKFKVREPGKGDVPGRVRDTVPRDMTVTAFCRHCLHPVIVSELLEEYTSQKSVFRYSGGGPAVYLHA